MKTKKRQILAMSAVVALTVSIAVTSCKKDKDDAVTTVQFAATVNGTAYQPSYVVAAQAYDLYNIDGFKIGSGDTAILSISVPDTVSANRVLDFDEASMDYMTRNGEYASGLSRSHGIVSVTTVDRTNKNIAGTFSGVLYKFNSSTDSVVITNGQFNTKYISQ